ncbi:MAG: hypothetical protein EOP49_20040 [Sphingobacteriales bacterium]|nr:MAG: hypothetical protein EOP49_20040 [Sphingobacteriales bacterium]
MDTNDNQPYMGDLEKTDIIYKMIQTPPAERNDLWNDMFLDALPTASFRCGDPQVITGPDGYPYFQLLLPEPGVEFQCYVIQNITPAFLLENGLGVVINPSEKGADWVLSYGDIVNYYLTGSFYTRDHEFAKGRGSEVIEAEEQVMVAQPSDSMLPQQTRTVLREYLKGNGIPEPKVLLMMRKNNGNPTQDLVFNITEKSFPNKDDYQGLMGSLRWFLPLHYSYAGMEEETFGSSFNDL